MVSINFRNFKSLKDIKLEEREKNVFSIVGPNNTGKSNFLAAIYALSTNYNFKRDDFVTFSSSTAVEKDINLIGKFGFLNKVVIKFIDDLEKKYSDLLREKYIFLDDFKELKNSKIYYEINKKGDFVST